MTSHQRIGLSALGFGSRLSLFGTRSDCGVCKTYPIGPPCCGKERAGANLVSSNPTRAGSGVRLSARADFSIRFRQACSLNPKMEALIIRIGLWGPLYYIYTKEPHKNSIGNFLGPYMTCFTENAAKSAGCQLLH